MQLINTDAIDEKNAKAVGIHIPLFNLVFHDCVIIPWISKGRTVHGGWGIPGSDSAYLHAILNGGPVYCPIHADEERIREVEEACAIAEKLAKEKMLRHEIIDGNIRRQRTIWSDGTVIEVDFDEDTYVVK